MKMLPPSPCAIPAASSAVAAVRIWSQWASASPRSPRRSQRDGAERAGGDAADEPPADLLGDELQSAACAERAFVRLGDGDRDEEERHAQAVVEPALHVEALSDPGRDAPVRHDCLPEGGVRAGEHDGEDERLDEAHPWKDGDAGHRAGRNRQGQAQPEEARRDAELAAERRNRDPRGVGEEDERQRRLGQQLDRLASELEVEQPERGPREQARRGEEDREGDVGPLEPVGKRGEDEQQEGDGCEGPGVHADERSADVLTGAPWRSDSAPRARSGGRRPRRRRRGRSAPSGRGP